MLKVFQNPQYVVLLSSIRLFRILVEHPVALARKVATFIEVYI
jgi:hypothetical protein